jgi:hypothetical protein
MQIHTHTDTHRAIKELLLMPLQFWGLTWPKQKEHIFKLINKGIPGSIQQGGIGKGVAFRIQAALCPGRECGTHRWHSSPLTPLVVQKHLPELVLHSDACPLHLHAEEKERESTSHKLKRLVWSKTFPKTKNFVWIEYDRKDWLKQEQLVDKIHDFFS